MTPTDAEALTRVGLQDSPKTAPVCPDVALWGAGLALLAMVAVAVVETVLRPTLGRGVDNAPLLIQHLGLVMTLLGAVAAVRHGHLTTLTMGSVPAGSAAWRRRLGAAALGWAAGLCGMLAWASGALVHAEREAGQLLAYGMPVWIWQAVMPVGFAWLGLRLGRECLALLTPSPWGGLRGAALSAAWPALGAALAAWADGQPVGLAWLAVVVIALLAGAPIFAALGGLSLLLFAHDGLPLASVALSHYQITVNPSLPALPLFTLAGVVLARTGAALRLSRVLQALSGGGVGGTVVAAAVLCSGFTALTGGSGVTILALGGLLLPMLVRAGYPENQGIGLVTSASALGVLLAPSVPLIMVAVVARVPIADMFLAGLLPAVLMVLCLLVVGGYGRPSHWRGRTAEGQATAADSQAAAVPAPGEWRLALKAARWELAAPLVAVGSLLSGLATPVEGAAWTAAYALFTQGVIHRELSAPTLARCVGDVVMIIGGVMLILGMALALTNWLVDAGVPDALTAWVQGWVSDRWVFLLLLCVFLVLAAALMEIYAAIVVLVPLLLPLAKAYGIEPLHFAIIFLAAMEMGFLCPPAGMNLYFASSMFGRPLLSVARAVMPGALSILVGTGIIAAVPALATALPAWLGSR